MLRTMLFFYYIFPSTSTAAVLQGLLVAVRALPMSFLCTFPLSLFLILIHMTPICPERKVDEIRIDNATFYISSLESLRSST